MKKKRLALLSCAMLALAGGTAFADTTYHFAWPTTETTFFKFASNDWLAESSPADSWDSDVDGLGNLTVFDSTTSVAHTTPYNISGSNIHAKVVIEDVEGSVDFSTHTAVWTITAHVAFSASGFVSEGSCKTTSFDVDFSGDYVAPTDSSTFTIASLSGSGTQACGGHASTINSDFALGGAGAKIHFNKFQITAI
jgi:hypothetical protein